MTARAVWLFVALLVASSLWLAAGALLTVAHRSPSHRSPVLTPATAPGVSAVIYQEGEGR